MIDPLLITLGFDPETFERLDGLRARYFPPDRNVVPAHVSLFHHLPGEEEAAVRESLGRVAGSTPPFSIRLGTPFRLGGGFAIRVVAPELDPIHAELARAFGPWLAPQDRQPFKPHVTIMNKADRDEARAAFDEFSVGWSPREARADSLRLWRYRGGPWDLVETFPFGAGSAGT